MKQEESFLSNPFLKCMYIMYPVIFYFILLVCMYVCNLGLTSKGASSEQSFEFDYVF